ncbi:hypothetical protein ACIGJO_27180 [Streptomyces sp. NPDC079020]|uniref:hypothetical protein n=1 Tax=Streptomyces sp. NPDC079020 TaxID=3365722 RepID=UPI0037CDB7A6
MTSIRTLVTGSAALLVLAAGGWGGYTWWPDAGTTTRSDSLCAPDLSRPEYVAAESANLALVTVTGTIGYLEEEPELPGGVQTVKVRIDTALKGAAAGTLALGQSVDVKRDGGFSTAGADNRYDVLRPGHQYIVSFYNGGSYGDGYVLYSEDTPDPDQAVERWTGHIATKAALPQPAEC